MSDLSSTSSQGAEFSSLPSLSAALKKTFWNVYDHLGKLVLLSFLSFLLVFTVIGLPFAVAGLFGLATEIADYKPVSVRGFFRYGVQGYVLALKLTALFVFGTVVLASNILFHLQNKLGLPALSMGMLIVTAWLSLLFLAWSFYLFPLAFRVGSFSRDIARSALGLVLDNKIYTAWLLLLYLLNWLAGAATFVLLVFFASGASAVFQATATRELLGKYYPAVVREDEELRTLRDLFRPWSV